MSLTKEQQIIIDAAHIDNAVEVGNGEVKANCPFCYTQNNKPFKFYINPQGLNICFKCGRQNNIISFLQEYLNISFKDAKELVSSQGALDNYENVDSEKMNNIFVSMINNLSDEKEKVSKKHMPELPTNTHSIYDNRALPETKPFISYLYSRGVSLYQIHKYGIRYCIKGTVKTTTGKNLSVNNSVIFITYSITGEPMYWNTRSIEINPYLKTLNASAQDGYSRKESVFGIDRVKNTDYLVITESVFNALTINDNFRNLKAVATFGKQITDTQLESILKVKPKRIYLGLDPDAQKESYDLYHRLVSGGYHGDIYMVNYPNDKDDFNDLGRQKSIQLLKQASVINQNKVLCNSIANNLKSVDI